MEDHEMRLIIKTRLGAPVIPGMEKLQRYSCGLCSQPYFGQDFAAHFLSCTAMTATEGLKRHNQIARIVAKYIERGGGSAIRELYARVTNSRKRADIDCVLGLFNYLIDVTVRNPTAQSHLPHADMTLSNAEQEKINKYEDQASPLHATVVPFAMDVYGSFSEEALRFATTIAKAKREDPTAAGVFKEMMNEISISLQRSNARMLARGIANHQERLCLPVITLRRQHALCVVLTMPSPSSSPRD